MSWMEEWIIYLAIFIGHYPACVSQLVAYKRIITSVYSVFNHCLAKLLHWELSFLSSCYTTSTSESRPSTTSSTDLSPDDISFGQPVMPSIVQSVTAKTAHSLTDQCKVCEANYCTRHCSNKGSLPVHYPSIPLGTC